MEINLEIKLTEIECTINNQLAPSIIGWGKLIFKRFNDLFNIH